MSFKQVEYEYQGKLYTIDIEVSEHLISKGSYSTAAECPDDYYDIYQGEYEVIAMWVSSEEDEEGREIKWFDDLPRWVVDSLEDEFASEYYN